MRPAPSLVARLRRDLGPLPAPGRPPALVVLIGPPGTGKTTLARALAAQAPVAVVSSDWVRKSLYPTPTYTDREHIRVFVHAFALVDVLLGQGIATVFDATNLREAGRRPLYRLAARHGCRLLLIRVTAPPDLVRARMEARTLGREPWDLSDADFSVYQELAASEEPLRRPYLEVDTGASNDAAAAIAGYLRDPTAAPPANGGLFQPRAGGTAGTRARRPG